LIKLLIYTVLQFWGAGGGCLWWPKRQSACRRWALPWLPRRTFVSGRWFMALCI